MLKLAEILCLSNSVIGRKFTNFNSGVGCELGVHG